MTQPLTRQLRMIGPALLMVLACAACGGGAPDEAGTTAEAPTPPESLEMGGEKSVTSFFITSRGPGNGGNLGGLAGADAHCQALAAAEGSGDRTWRAYLSTADPVVHARDRIGTGPWYNAEGLLIAADLDELHGEAGRIGKDTAVTERLDVVEGVGDTPNRHDILTGSREDGTAFPAADDLDCRGWTSADEGRAQVGHHDRRGRTEGVNSWNSVHATQACTEAAFEATGGAGLFYCFAID